MQLKALSARQWGRENEYQSVLNWQKKGSVSFRIVSDEHIQLLHDGNNHWFLSFCSNGRVQIYVTVYEHVSINFIGIVRTSGGRWLYHFSL